ncbi:Protein kinase protein rad53 [Yamadazyma tenuis]|uniref:Serine/threonine-protein kinase RAD53 n=1 Tax=Candida tenuis (strain ATCC 10573 / BCRC 21748 / CBS 615 / JCM 9827 / NBRC 10315 / NRRL Y-1498 / VKM Y-70) TaxID=590646 RepID=G3BDW6_CANTC|nr:Pkinase-domain-containing protein [Yamadazyma tenuis ATCC 10573]EGV60398.1 Pkinase-domain-containing protein [Yamadazyma tenuis ATCC 10573]WEJ94355.1 Protein kinase protein rad53 [Yamadazyma tenuis]
MEPTQATQPTQQSPSTQAPSTDPNHLCRLICTTGQYTFFDFNISGGKKSWSFGRNQENDFILNNSTRYSNKHFKFWFNIDGKTLWVQDTSTNGTYLNNNRLVKGSNYMLNQGDEVSVGNGVRKDELKFVVLFSDLFNPSNHNSTIKDEGIYKDFIVHNETIGQGAFATVKKVIERATGDAYAVKIINKRKALNTGGGMVEVERELSILRKLNHPNIVKLKSFYEDLDNYYLVMEFVPGGDLMDFVAANGAIGEEATRVITKQILKGIHYVHSKGISHRDLKPDNILIMSDDPIVVKISDFGLAKISDNSTFMKTFCGTLAYVAPEIITGKYGASQPTQTQTQSQSPNTLYDNSVDIWSLGCLVYVLLTSHLPFNGKTQNQMFSKIKSGQYHTSPLNMYKVSELGLDFIKNCLIVKPEDRFTTEQALNHEWIKSIDDGMGDDLEFPANGGSQSQRLSLSQSQSQQLRKIDNGISITSNNQIDDQDQDMMMRPLKKEEFKVPKRVVPLPQSQPVKRDNDDFTKVNGFIKQSTTQAVSGQPMEGPQKKFTNLPLDTFIMLEPTKDSMLDKPIVIRQGINPYAIGRNETCDTYINDDRMSKIHCLLNRRRHPVMELSIYESPAHCLEDIWLLDFSTNSCFLNGGKIGKGNKIQIFDGDRLDLFVDQYTHEGLSYTIHIIDKTGLFNEGKRVNQSLVIKQDANDQKLRPMPVDSVLNSVIGNGGNFNSALRSQKKRQGLENSNSVVKRADLKVENFPAGRSWIE